MVAESFVGNDPAWVTGRTKKGAMKESAVITQFLNFCNDSIQIHRFWGDIIDAKVLAKHFYLVGSHKTIVEIFDEIYFVGCPNRRPYEGSLIDNKEVINFVGS